MLRSPWSLCAGRRTPYLSVAIWLTLAVFRESAVQAQSTAPTLIRVEEDWVAMIGEPDAATSSPQILNFISPTSSTTGVFGLVQMNHRGAPEFSDGGAQVQGWNGDWMTGFANSNKFAKLYRTSDALRYTIAMERTDTATVFQLLNGRSRTWGRFAQTPVSVLVPGENRSLEDYSPDYSVANTTVNLGAHRVVLLYMTATRLKYSDGTTVTDNTDRVPHRYQLNVEDVSQVEYDLNSEEYTIEITE